MVEQTLARPISQITSHERRVKKRLGILRTILGVYKLKEEREGIVRFLDDRYGISKSLERRSREVNLTAHPEVFDGGEFKVVWFYGLRDNQEYGQKLGIPHHVLFQMPKATLWNRIKNELSMSLQLLRTSFCYLGMYNPKTHQTEVSIFSYLLSSRASRLATLTHETMHAFQRNSRLSIGLYSICNSEDCLALRAIGEGMAMDAEYAYMRTLEKELITSIDKVKRFIYASILLVLDPVRSMRRLLGKDKKANSMTAEERMQFIYENPNKAELVFDPYTDGYRFFASLVKEFGPETAFEIALTYPNISIKHILVPKIYTGSFREAAQEVAYRNRAQV